MTAVLRACRAFCASIGLIFVVGIGASVVSDIVKTANERDRLRDDVARLRIEIVRLQQRVSD